MEDNEYRDPDQTQQIHRAARRARAIFGEEVAVQARHELELLRREPPAKPISFLPRATRDDIVMYDVAAYVVRWAEEPDTSLPSVRHLVHRLRQAVSDNPIVYPYNQENALPPSPATIKSHQVLRPTDARFHGRAIAARPPPQQQAPTPRPAPRHVPVRIRQLTQP